MRYNNGRKGREFVMKNYHTHTRRCHHAIDSEEDYIKAAIQAGYTELGFSDHTPWVYASSFHPTMRMEASQIEEYVSKLLKLKEKYKNQINIKIGLECEYFPKYMNGLKNMLKTSPIDYIILGQHYDESDEEGVYFGYPLTSNQFIKYVDTCIEAMETGLYSYIAHPDLARFDTEDPLYHEEMKRLCLKAKELDIPVEFNLLGYKTHRHYPCDAFFKIAKKVGNHVIIGTDAHEARALADRQTYDQAQAYLENLGIEMTESIRFLR